MTKNPTKTDRMSRYRRIILAAVSQPVFELEELQRKCSEESRRFVTRFVNELAAGGWLLREHNRRQTFRWNQSKPFVADQWLQEKLGNRIAASPQQDRPRERLLSAGADHLKTSELLAILIRSGRAGESAVQAGQKIANAFADKLEKLPQAAHGEIKLISPAVGPAAYCQIMAGIELGRRVAEQARDQRPRSSICSSSEAIAYCEQRFERLMTDARKEEFHIVTLDTKNQVIDTHEISVGTLDASLVHPREVFRAAIKDAASSIILVHNHPSGDPTPSKEDRQVTARLESAGETIGIDVLDHIVLGAFRSVSIRESE